MTQTPSPDLPEPSQPQGISLGELTEAFAQAMGAEAAAKTGPEAVEQPTTEPQAAGDVDEAAEAGESPPQRMPQQPPEPSGRDDDPCRISPLTILEAMLFVGNREGQPLAAARAAELMRGVEPEEITALVEQLNQRYSDGGCPYHIVREGSGFRLTLRKAFHALRNRFYGRVREARLSQAAIEVLAIVAYQQPLTGEQINRLRGKPSSHMLAQLVRRGLLRIERTPAKRRTVEYFTTDRFLKLFGLETLDDLPQSEELDRR